MCCYPLVESEELQAFSATGAGVLAVYVLHCRGYPRR
jgi:hypothetical protein